MARLTPETNRFLRKAVAGLPFLKRNEVRAELRAHIEDAIQRHDAQDERASAERKAVGALGDVADLKTSQMKLHALEDAIRKRRAQDATPAHGEQGAAAESTPPNHARTGEEIRALEDLRHGLAEHIVFLQAEREAVMALGDAAALNRELLRAHFGGKWPLHFLRDRFVRLLRGPLNFMVRVQRDEIQCLIVQGRHGEAIERAQREFTMRGPSLLSHQRLAAAFSASGDHERALTHRQAAVDWLTTHPVSWRFIEGQHVALGAAYCNLAGALSCLGREDEAEAAVRAGLAVDDENFMLNLLQAKYCLKRGDYDGAFHHLEASLDEDCMVFDVGKSLLMFLHGNDFEPLRQDARFGRLLRRAYDWA